MLRIVSKADTAEGFIQIFSHLCDRESLFIVTRSPKEIGTETRFSINLKTGEPLISGHGKVTARYETKDNPYGRVGMKLAFLDLDDGSREFIEQLVAARNARQARPMPPPIPPASTRARSALPAEFDDVTAVDAQAPQDLKPEVDRSRPVTSNGEQRVQGSDFILPANPFGELTDTVLEAFVECSLYEDTSNLPGETPTNGQSESHRDASAAPDSEGARPLSMSPGATPRASTAQAPAPRPAHMPPVPTSADAFAETEPAKRKAENPAMALQGMSPASEPAGVAGPPAPSAALPAERPSNTMRRPTYPKFDVPAAHATTEPHQARQSASWKPVILAAAGATVVATLVSLLVAYMIWGRNSSAAEEPAASSTARSTGKQGTDPEAGKDTPPDKASPQAKDTPDQRSTEQEPSNDSADINGAGKEPGADKDTDITDAPRAGGDCQATITSEPEGATVFVGERELGTTPFETALPCGEVELRFTRARRDPTLETVTLAPGQPNDIAVDLQRPKVKLSVTSEPAGADVTVNGKSAGKTPTSIKVAGYRYAEVEVKKPGYKTYTEKVYPKDSSTTVRAKLKPARKR